MKQRVTVEITLLRLFHPIPESLVRDFSEKTFQLGLIPVNHTHFQIGDCVSISVVQLIRNGDLPKNYNVFATFSQKKMCFSKVLARRNTGLLRNWNNCWERGTEPLVIINMVLSIHNHGSKNSKTQFSKNWKSQISGHKSASSVLVLR